MIHADAGSQFTSVRLPERLDEIGARPSIGTVADSFDNALAETTNGLFKTECIYGPDAPRQWADVGEVELATLTWVHLFNEHRLHSHCGHIPPAKFETAFYAAQQTDPAGVGNPIARASNEARLVHLGALCRVPHRLDLIGRHGIAGHPFRVVEHLHASSTATATTMRSPGDCQLPSGAGGGMTRRGCRAVCRRRWLTEPARSRPSRWWPWRPTTM